MPRPPLHLSKQSLTPRLLEVITLGRNIGAVLFNDGRRVRNSPLNELYTSSLGTKFLEVSGCSDLSTEWAGHFCFGQRPKKVWISSVSQNRL